MKRKREVMDDKEVQGDARLLRSRRHGHGTGVSLNHGPGLWQRRVQITPVEKGIAGPAVGNADKMRQCKRELLLQCRFVEREQVTRR